MTNMEVNISDLVEVWLDIFYTFFASQSVENLRKFLFLKNLYLFVKNLNLKLFIFKNKKCLKNILGFKKDQKVLFCKILFVKSIIKCLKNILGFKEAQKKSSGHKCSFINFA